MNITTGGPHILLFERDQQFVVLLTSELQLAGYECHTARTAVEVFDAIARYPVRLVLVNLAQAAAARREFWVALDTQRRGRGVQVFTFHCTNIAGYGPPSDEIEERSQNVLADMEVDGMLGIMNMVNAIRSRIAVANTMSRSGANMHTNSSTTGQAPTTIQAETAGTSNQPQAEMTFADNSTPNSSQLSPSFSAISTPPSSPTEPPLTPMPMANPTDKIQAIIYPNQRSWNTARDNSLNNGQTSASSISKEQQPAQEAGWSARNAQHTSRDQPAASTASSPLNTSRVVETAANGQTRRLGGEAGLPNESGLAQLSRMVQEQRSPTLDELAQELGRKQRNPFQEDTALQPRVRPDDVPPLSTISLRASPIQDMPIDRIGSGQHDTTSTGSSKRPEETIPYASQAQSTPTLLSLATPTTPAPASASIVPPTPVLAVPPTPTIPPTPSPSPRPSYPREGVVDQVFVETADTHSSFPSFPPDELSMRDESNNDEDIAMVEPMVSQDIALPELMRKAADNALLLDIVQSLPPMTSPPPQLQVHNGRATRSLGSVLLEGHLVPQNRLEVAQGIQRMLRGVDMNYQLGEILLMFKLLTPDQLLAASLVSYGLITTTQISALGRIRQELHSIGLEYDLENLLILFRILTSEQLREMRMGWSG